MTNEILSLDGVTKTFPPRTVALTDATLSVVEGEVHCIIGANGAGKSTLMKIVSGAIRPSAGQVLFSGQEFRVRSPSDASSVGIAMIYQELDLVPQLSVEQNLFLGHVPNRRGVISKKKRRRLARETLARIKCDIDPRADVGTLSVANQQFTAIARALTMNARLLIMDEPSAALNSRELAHVFAVIREITRDGVAVVYTSHRLHEILEIGDRVTVLRGGRTIETFDIADADEQRLISAIVGDERVLVDRQERPQLIGDVALHVIEMKSPHGLDVRDLQLRRGEISGLTGLSGSGRTGFLRALFGAEPFDGKIFLHGEPFSPHRPSDAVGRGLGLVTKSRKSDGLVLGAGIARNSILASLAGSIALRRSSRHKQAERVLHRLATKYSRLEQPVIQLSGGNQQKVVLSKWVLSGADVLLMNEPSRGLDLGAKSDLYELVRALADDGAAVLIASSEIEELYAVCDSIWIFRDGKNVSLYDAQATSPDEILHSIVGGRTRHERHRSCGAT